jgi:hypothetical protein
MVSTLSHRCPSGDRAAARCALALLQRRWLLCRRAAPPAAPDAAAASDVGRMSPVRAPNARTGACAPLHAASDAAARSAGAGHVHCPRRASAWRASCTRCARHPRRECWGRRCVALALSACTPAPPDKPPCKTRQQRRGALTRTPAPRLRDVRRALLVTVRNGVDAPRAPPKRLAAAAAPCGRCTAGAPQHAVVHSPRRGRQRSLA